MVDSTGAKSLYAYIVEPDSTSGYNCRMIRQGTETLTNYSNATTMFQDISDFLSTIGGGRVGIRNGLYLIDGSEIYIPGEGVQNALLQWGNPGSATNPVDIILEGETREGVIIRNTYTPPSLETDFFGAFCSLELRNITLDNDALGNLNGGTAVNILRAREGTDGKRILRANNCEFIDHTGYGFRVPSNRVITPSFLGSEATNNIFRRTCTGDDMCRCHPDGWGKTIGNYFDTRVAGVSSDGQCITGGTSINMQISDNVIERSPEDIRNGISLEPFSGNCKNVLIHDNIVNYGIVKVGQDTWAGTAKNILIRDNIVTGGQIRLKGPTSGDYSTELMHAVIKGNTLIDSPQYGIRVNNTAGICEVRNNLVINSNGELDAGTNNSCIHLDHCLNMICENNTIYMGLRYPPDVKFSPAGIKYTFMVSSKIQGNRIFNLTTTPNPNYVNGGGHSGTNIFSHNT
jgi:hypothetical protein